MKLGRESQRTIHSLSPTGNGNVEKCKCCNSKVMESHKNEKRKRERQKKRERKRDGTHFAVAMNELVCGVGYNMKNES